MIGIGVVTHNDLIDKRDDPETTDAYEMLIDLIQTVDLYTNKDYVLIIRDNDSFDYRFNKLHATLKRKFGHINSVFIHSNVNNLTDAWNQILKIALHDFECEGVAILNQDIIVTKTWHNFIRALYIQSRDMLAPMSSSAVFQDLQQIKEEKFDPENKMLQVPCVQGFCYGGSRRAFEENMYDSTHYFNPKIEWDYNDEEWQQRNNDSGGRSFILCNTYIIHMDKTLWDKAGLKSTTRPNRLYTHEYRQSILHKIAYYDYVLGKDTT